MAWGTALFHWPVATWSVPLDGPPFLGILSDTGGTGGRLMNYRLQWKQTICSPSPRTLRPWTSVPNARKNKQAPKAVVPCVVAWRQVFFSARFQNSWRGRSLCHGSCMPTRRSPSPNGRGSRTFVSASRQTPAPPLTRTITILLRRWSTVCHPTWSIVLILNACWCLFQCHFHNHNHAHFLFIWSYFIFSIYVRHWRRYFVSYPIFCWVVIGYVNQSRFSHAFSHNLHLVSPVLEWGISSFSKTLISSNVTEVTYLLLHCQTVFKLLSRAAGILVSIS